MTARIRIRRHALCDVCFDIARRKHGCKRCKGKGRLPIAKASEACAEKG